MKFKELKLMSKEELKEKLSDIRLELIKLNSQISTGTTPKSPGQAKNLKKTVARILTIFNQEKKKEEDKKKSNE